MIVRLFVLLSLFGLSYAVSCNSVSMEDEENHIDIYPTNVCIAYFDDVDASSYTFVCDSSGVARMQFFESNSDCSGTPTPLDIANTFGITSYISICDSTPCEYALLEWWFGITSCDGDTATEYTEYHSSIALVGTYVECQKDTFDNSSMTESCLNGEFTSVYYEDGITDCSGEAKYTSYTPTQCSVQNDNALRYTCNLVAPDSFNPKPQPTTAQPTIDPEVGNSVHQVVNSITFVFLVIVYHICIVCCV